MLSYKRGKQQLYDIQPMVASLPSPEKRTRIRSTQSSYMSTGVREYRTPPGPAHKVQTLYEAIQRIPDSWICSWISESEDLEQIVLSLRSGEGLGISDGSFQKKWDLCSAGWILWTPVGEIKGGGTVPGPHNTSNAYRGELGGLLGLVIIVRLLEQLFPPSRPYSLKLGCDGLSALSRSMLTTREYLNTTHKDFDLISRIISYREDLKANLIPIHVKGHQEVNNNLTLAETLNHRMDTLAKEINKHAHENDIPIPDALHCSRFGITQVDHDSEPIVSELAKTLVNRISGDRVKRYWKKKGRYDENHIETWIDWKVMSRMMREASHRRRLFISKWVSNQVAVGTIMVLRSERLKDTCPCCEKESETRTHLLRCRYSKTAWKNARKPLKKWMNQQKTDPNIRRAILDILRSYQKRKDYDSYVPTGFSTSLQQCLNAQSHIGITNMLEGMLTYDWAEEQQKYYSSIRSRKTGHRWAIGLSVQLWNIIHAMWENRNNVLHQNQVIESLSGLDIVKQAIRAELQKGLSTLDPLYYSYFNFSSTDIAKMKSVDARNWLVLIRRAREAKGFCYYDKISQSQPLQKWIGLTIPKKANKTYLRLIRTGYND